MSRDQFLCPSSSCREGAILVGVVLHDGRVAYAADRIHVDAEFVALAEEGRAPEKRFRFGNRCVEGGCRQWTGARCGVIDAVLGAAPEADGEVALPQCSIRAGCRWFAQAGAEACAVCAFVVTDTR